MFLHPREFRLRVPGLLRPGTRTAFSLVEVVTAMAVFSFAMASMLTLLPAGLLNYQKAQNTTVFAQIVQNVTSTVELIGLANINFTTTNFYFDDQGSPLTQTQSGSALYTAQVTLQPLSGTKSVLNPLAQTAGMQMSVYVIGKGQASTTNYFSTILSY